MFEASRREVLSTIAGVAVAGAGGLSGEAIATDELLGTASASDLESRIDASDPEPVVDEVMSEWIGDRIPGATVAVVEGDDLLLAKGYGHADARSETPVRANETAFRIGSVCKLVTWTAVMQGVEDGILALDADVNTYLEESAVEIPDTYDRPITLRHLGTHTPGFDNVPDPGLVESADKLTHLETALVDNRPKRVRPPGETVAYSNYGAMLAGHVVAEAYDTTFEEYVRSEIFDPLGMDHSTFVQPVPEDHPGSLARPHEPSGDTFEPADPVYINWRPAGSMSATATDMAAFMSAHLGGGATGGARILDSETVEAMHSQQHQRHPAVTDWRYGFYEYGHPDGSVIAHSGGTPYFLSWLGLAPEHDIGVFLSFNASQNGGPNEVGEEVLAEYGIQSGTPTYEPTSGPEATDRLKKVTGEYEASRTPRTGDLQILNVLNRMTVETTDGGRLVTETQIGRTEWIETEPYVFRQTDGDDVLAFEVVDGRVEAAHKSSNPASTFEPVSPRERQIVTLGAVGTSVGGFALSLVGWTGLAGWRRLQRYRTDSGEGTDPADETAEADTRTEGSA